MKMIEGRKKKIESIKIVGENIKGRKKNKARKRGKKVGKGRRKKKR